jgi:hypothetical protein
LWESGIKTKVAWQDFVLDCFPAASFRAALLPDFKASVTSDFGKVIWKTV